MPTIFFVLPFFILAFLPVVALEAWVYRVGLGLPFREARQGSVRANWRSTVMAVPLTWMLFACYQPGLRFLPPSLRWHPQFVVVRAVLPKNPGEKAASNNAGTGPSLHEFLHTPLRRLAFVAVQAACFEGLYESESSWMVPASLLVLMLPFFLASAVLEWCFLLRWWQHLPRARLTGCVWLANLLSYGALACWCALWLVVADPSFLRW